MNEVDENFFENMKKFAYCLAENILAKTLLEQQIENNKLNQVVESQIKKKEE